MILFSLIKFEILSSAKSIMSGLLLVFFVFLIVLLSNKCACLFCPENMEICEGGVNLVKLECISECLPDLNNKHFGIYKFNNVISTIDTTWNNVTCDTLIIEGKSNNFYSIELLKNLNITYLELINMENNLLNGIFKIEFNLVKQITFELLNVDRFNFKFHNFPNIEVINTANNNNSIKILTANVFKNLKKIHHINLKNTNISSLEYNSLNFTSNEMVNVDLGNNNLIGRELERPGLFNAKGLQVDLNLNHIAHFRERFFIKYFDSKLKISINLDNNPILCINDEIKWIFNYTYDFRTSPSFPLKSIYCKNMDNKALLFMNESDFQDNGS